MKQEDIDWKSGNVIYWDLDGINATRALTDQLWELKEDLAQVSFGDEVLIDIGWYPDFSPHGHFLILVVRNGDWENPFWEGHATSVEQLMNAAANAVTVAEQLQNEL